jgi:hypothetical protein
VTDPASHEALEQLLNELERMGDRAVADTARRAIHAVLDLHRAGLAQVVHHLAQAPALQAELVRDPAVAALLLLHGLHPDSLATRVARAAGQVRASGAGVEVVHADSDAVRVRMSGVNEADAVRALEAALLEHAPDAGPLIVERLPTPGAVIPVDRLVRRGETCELCGAAIAGTHEHLAAGQGVQCVCSVCARTARAPSLHLHARPIAAPDLPEALWQRLGIPVELAFIVERASGGRIALYPGPAGLVEAPVDAAAWREVSPVPDLQPDSEALLCDRLSQPPRYYQASIAACYAIAGLFRRHWGAGGRHEAWSQVRGFLEGLAQERST